TGGVAGIPGAAAPPAAAPLAGVDAGSAAPVVGAGVIGDVGEAPDATLVAAGFEAFMVGVDATFELTPIDAAPAVPDAAAVAVSADAPSESSLEDAAEHPSTPDNESAVQYKNRFRIRLSYGLAVMPEPLSKPYASASRAKYEVFSVQCRVSLCQIPLLP
ncbi:MAG TPA: hypothetical protein VMF89_00145, partial [Polyangiales bacterium]|nr:hypothetical protein [Polyangiales bacterium]